LANLDENNKNEESFGSDDEVRSFYTAVNQLDRVPQKRPLLFFSITQVWWTNLYGVHIKFSQDLTYQKSLKSVNF